MKLSQKILTNLLSIALISSVYSNNCFSACNSAPGKNLIKYDPAHVLLSIGPLASIGATVDEVQYIDGAFGELINDEYENLSDTTETAERCFQGDVVYIFEEKYLDIDFGAQVRLNNKNKSGKLVARTSDNITRTTKHEKNT